MNLNLICNKQQLEEEEEEGGKDCKKIMEILSNCLNKFKPGKQEPIIAKQVEEFSPYLAIEQVKNEIIGALVNIKVKKDQSTSPVIKKIKNMSTQTEDLVELESTIPISEVDFFQGNNQEYATPGEEVYKKGKKRSGGEQGKRYKMKM